MSVLQCFDLSGKTALVTGCKRGIGKAKAVTLAEASDYLHGTILTVDGGWMRR